MRERGDEGCGYIESGSSEYTFRQPNHILHHHRGRGEEETFVDIFLHTLSGVVDDV
jgi:hypothetical protein